MVFHFSLLYRKPVFYSFLGLLILILIISFGVALTSFHEKMFFSGKARNFPGIGPFYEGYQKIDFRNIYCVKIFDVYDKELIVECLDAPTSQKVRAIFPDDFTRTRELKAGEIIILFGKKEDSIIKAFDFSPKNAVEFCEHRRLAPLRNEIK